MVAERDRGVRGDAAAVFFGAEVARVFEFAQVRDQVPGRQPDHVLQPGERERVALGQRRQRRDDAQPGRDVDQRVEHTGGHVCTFR